MLGQMTPKAFEVVVHQHMPMFHMEHCVFAAMLSNGKDATDCGRPCDRHKVELRDRVGAAFPLVADTGCRNTVFNSVAQSAAEFIPKMLALGVRHFRVELLRESHEQDRAALGSLRPRDRRSGSAAASVARLAGAEPIRRHPRHAANGVVDGGRFLPGK